MDKTLEKPDAVSSSAALDGSAYLRDYVIVQRPGKVPDRKGPLADKKHMGDMLRELYQHCPDCTCTVIKLPVDSWPQSGREWLDMYGDRRRKRLPRS